MKTKAHLSEEEEKKIINNNYACVDQRKNKNAMRDSVDGMTKN